MSQLDSLDPKPHLPAEIRGPFSAVQTKTKNALVTEPFAALGAVDDEYTVLRGMDAENASGSHSTAAELWMRSEERDPRTNLFPQLTRGTQGRMPGGDLMTPDVEAEPGFVFAGYRRDYVGNSGSPLIGVDWDDKEKKCVTKVSFDKPPSHEARTELLRSLDSRGGFAGGATDRFLENARLADAIVRRGFANAFDDPNPGVAEARRRSYGDDAHGKMFQLAGALADPDRGNAKLTVVTTGHWDHHYELKDRMEPRARNFSRGLAALIHELRDRVIIVVRGEFGRYNKDTYPTFGRQHHAIHSGLITGPNIKIDKPYGATSRDGRNVDSGRITNETFRRLMLQAAGVVPRTFDNDAITALLKV